MKFILTRYIRVHLNQSLKSFLLVILTFFLNPFLQAQWNLQYYDETSYHNKIQFKSENSGLMIGDRSTILKTTNGGKDWKKIKIATQVNFQDFQYVGANSIIAMGHYYEPNRKLESTVFISLDFGRTWQIMSVMPDRQLYSQWFFSTSVGLVCGYKGIYRTKDRGLTWDKTSTSYYGNYNHLFFINDTVGFVSNGGKLLKTLDQGETWNEIHTFKSDISSIYFFNERKGVLGVGEICNVTFDSGSTWSENLIAEGLSILSIDFISDSIGFIVSSYTGGIPLDHNYIITSAISRTFDGGISWETSVHRGELYSIDFLSENYGFISGGGNFIMNYSGNDFDKMPEDYPWRITSTFDQIVLTDKVFPNPVKDKLTVESKYLSKIRSIECYTVKGELIALKQERSNQSIHLNLGKLKKGLYLLKIKGSRQSQTIRFLKE